MLNSGQPLKGTTFSFPFKNIPAFLTGIFDAFRLDVRERLECSGTLSEF